MGKIKNQYVKIKNSDNDDIFLLMDKNSGAVFYNITQSESTGTNGAIN